MTVKYADIPIEVIQKDRLRTILLRRFQPLRILCSHKHLVNFRGMASRHINGKHPRCHAEYRTVCNRVLNSIHVQEPTLKNLSLSACSSNVSFPA